MPLPVPARRSRRVLFGIGVYVVLARRHAMLVLMGVELMLNAVNLNLVAFDAWWHDAARLRSGARAVRRSRSPPPRSASGWRSCCWSSAPTGTSTSTSCVSWPTATRSSRRRCEPDRSGVHVVIVAPGLRLPLAGAAVARRRAPRRAAAPAVGVAGSAVARWASRWSSASSTGAIGAAVDVTGCTSRPTGGIPISVALRVDQLSASMLVLATIGGAARADLLGRLPARRPALPVVRRARLHLHRRRWRSSSRPTTCSCCWSAGRSWAPAPTS